VMIDKHLLAFFRRTPMDWVTQRDIDLSGDVYSLQPLLFFLSYSIQAKTLVEIGVADGSTTVPMLMSARDNKGMLHSIDKNPWYATNDLRHVVESMENYEQYFKYYDCGSDDFFKSFNEKIDFAFIDGDHNWEQVARDVFNCLERLSNNGILFISDFGMHSGRDAKDTPGFEYVYKDKTYEDKCNDGIYKGLKQVLPMYPEFQAIAIQDRSNPFVIIARHWLNRKMFDK